MDGFNHKDIKSTKVKEKERELMIYELRLINKKSVGAEAAQISPKLSMSLPRLFPDTNAVSFLPKNRLFVNENLKFMDICCLQ